MNRLLRGIFIYGGGQVVTRLITFLLLPLTTAYIYPQDYGVLSALSVSTMCLNGLFTLGFGIAVSRCYCGANDPQEKNEIIWSAVFSLALYSFVLLGVSYYFLDSLCQIARIPHEHQSLLMYSLGSLAISSILLPITTCFRIHEQAFLVVSCSLLEIVTSISITLFLVIIEGLGCKGVVVGTFAGHTCGGILMFLLGWKNIPLFFSKQHISEMIRVGYPYMFGLAGYFLLQSSSRYLLEKIESIEVAGLFFLGSNLGRTAEILVSSFITAWAPYQISYVTKFEEAAVLFPKVLRFYVLGMCAILSCYFALAKLVVFMMIQPTYHNIWTVIGIVAVAQSLWGVYSISATGFIFHKKSMLQMCIEITAGGTVILFNYLLIPTFKMEGAALAMLLGFSCLIILSFAVNHQLFPITYQVKDIVKAVSGLAIVAFISFLPIDNFPTYLTINVVSCLLYLIFIWTMCCTAEEKNRLKNKFQKFTHRGVILKI